jgi:hypothetical protein
MSVVWLTRALHHCACLSRELLGNRMVHGKAARKHYVFAGKGQHPGWLSRGPIARLESGQHLGGAGETLCTRSDAALQDRFGMGAAGEILHLLGGDLAGSDAGQKSGV